MREVTIYVDGACRGNPGPGGYAAILVASNGISREISGGFRLTTNSRMEIMAVIQALSALKEPCYVTLYSDSQYVVNAIENGWLRMWQANGWRKSGKGQVENADLWHQLVPLLATHRVTFVWLRGHNGHPLNERCDKLAEKACRTPNLPPDEGYEIRRKPALRPSRADQIY